MEELLSILPLAFQAGKGLSDLFTGNSFGNAQRPWESVPPSVAQATALARSQAASPILPGAGLIQNQISGNTAAGVNTAIQGGNPQGSIGALVNNQNTQFQNLALKGVERQDKNMAAYGQQLNNQGQYEQQAWDWNYKQPYQYAQTAANTYREGGLGEIFNALKGGGQTYMLLDALNKLKQGSNLNSPASGGAGGGQTAGGGAGYGGDGGDGGAAPTYGQDPSQQGLGLPLVDYGAYGWNLPSTPSFQRIK
jgi:hypothetical protein